jgi:hypothetical protein
MIHTYPQSRGQEHSPFIWWKKKVAEGNVDNGVDVLAALAQELELEDDVVDTDDGAADDDNKDEEFDCEGDDEDGLGDGRDGMTEEEVDAIVPVQLMLTKVSHFKLSLILSNPMPTWKLRALANTIKNSSTIIFPKWFEKLEDLNLNAHMMPRDVATHWNSTLDMLNFALDYRIAIDSILSNRDLNLRKYELQDTEWEAAEALCDTLKACILNPIGNQLYSWIVILRRSSNTLLIFSPMIPAMDHIDTHLANATKNTDYSPSIHAALAIGKQILNWYYNKTDQSEVYRIVMGERPSTISINSIDIFTNFSTSSKSQTPVLQDCWLGRWVGQNSMQHRSRWVWPDIHIYGFWWGSYFDEKGTSMRFVDIFICMNLSLPNTTGSPRRPPTYSMIYLRYQLRRLQSFTMSLTGTLPLILSKWPMSASGGIKGGWRNCASVVWHWITSQFQVCTLLQSSNNSILMVWKLATSADVEHVFSQGHILLSHLHSRLSVQSTWALMCLGAWSSLGFVSNSDIKAVVRLPEIPADTMEDDIAIGWDAIFT